MVVRVLLAEDNVLLREGLTKVIDGEPDLEVIGAVGDLPTLLERVGAESPDVVVTDIRMPPTGTDEGIRAANQLRDEQPSVGVVVLSQYANPSYALALLAEGSEGRAYLLKERVSDVDDLLHAIRVVAGGGSVIDPKVVEALVTARSPRHRTDAARDRDPAGDGEREEQRRHRRGARVERTRRREAHELDLLEARPLRGAQPEPARQGRAALPGGDERTRRLSSGP